MKKTGLRNRNGRGAVRRTLTAGTLKADKQSATNQGTSSSTTNGNTTQAERSFCCITPDVRVGQNVKLSKFINLYGCEVGDDTKVGAFVEIQRNAKIGRRCKISSHTFICEGVTIEDEVFIGHNVTFVNDTFPRATTATGSLQTEADWKVETTLVKNGVSIGSGATILANVVIGEHALIGAGAVITKDVPANAIVVGNPGKVVRYVGSRGQQ